MRFSLVICTYMRPESLLSLLNSITKQTLYPNEILIIDGSTNDETSNVIYDNDFENLKYYKVDEATRGLTRQRNFGVDQVNDNIDIICFLDDDTELEEDYFEEIIRTFKNNTQVIGVSGIAVNENKWSKISSINKIDNKQYYVLDGFIVKEGLRNVARNYLGLQSPLLPFTMPNFSHGRTNGYPLNNKIYQVDALMGMSFNFRKSIFDKIKFSTYFEGYGLYEDTDFSLRALKYGKNVINTAARLNHYHDHSGRPNKFKYGKMVIRNGWYVWRIKFPKPTLKARLKWNLTSFLLVLIRFVNVINTNKKMEALTEASGRVVGWFSLIFNKPKLKV